MLDMVGIPKKHETQQSLTSAAHSLDEPIENKYYLCSTEEMDQCRW